MVQMPAVLVVEDEPIIRFDVVDALEDAGIEALEAANAAEALMILDRRSDISVVSTDINMAGNLDGLGLARLIKFRWPSIRIVVTSGHVHLRDEHLPADSVFVGKPYDLSNILPLLSPRRGAQTERSPSPHGGYASSTGRMS